MVERPTSHAARLVFWEGVHHGKAEDSVSWWQSVPELSLRLVEQAGVPKSAAVLDVGAGSSTLVDHLLALGYRDLTAVDLSASALAAIRERLGPPGSEVVLETADVLDLHLGRRFALWHDRAVFHFLVEAVEREAYRASLHRTLAPGGSLIVATFGPDAPTMCSGLPIVRYSQDELATEFADGFDVVATTTDEHFTPWGATQQFVAVLLRGSS
jgi:SAM-dependent methyltransferase